jgi:hypothetical protein
MKLNIFVDCIHFKFISISRILILMSFVYNPVFNLVVVSPLSYSVPYFVV